MQAILRRTRQDAAKQRKCWVCGNKNCPHPTIEERSKAEREKWGGDPQKKECWMPIEVTDFQV